VTELINLVVTLNTCAFVCNVSQKCLSLGLGPKIEGLGLEKISEGLGLHLISDYKSEISVSSPVSSRNVSFTFVLHDDAKMQINVGRNYYKSYDKQRSKCLFSHFSY